MKKLILFFVFFFVMVFSSFSQEWIRDVDLEEELYSFNIDVEAYVYDSEDLFGVSFEDYESENWSDVRYSLSSLLTYIELVGVDSDIDIEDLNVIYVWIDSETDYEILMNPIILEKYFDAKRSDKSDIIEEMISEQEIRWETKHEFYFAPRS